MRECEICRHELEIGRAYYCLSCLPKVRAMRSRIPKPAITIKPARALRPAEPIIYTSSSNLMLEDDYRAMLSDQAGLCAICRQAQARKALAVDHCHTTGTIRGLLCNSCNLAIGLFRDDVARMRAAADYVARFPQSVPVEVGDLFEHAKMIRAKIDAKRGRLRQIML